MEKITLYTNPQSRGFMALWMLEECAIPYELEIIAYGSEIKSPNYLAINPMGKVPALKQGNTILTETAAIVTYLADQVPDKKLAPPIQTAARGEYYRWLFFCTNTFEQAIINQFLGFNAQTDDARKMLSYGSLETVLNTLRLQLKQKQYLVNDQFTSADLLMASLIEFGINRLNQIPKQAVFTDYVTRIQQRTAYQKAMKITQDLIG